MSAQNPLLRLLTVSAKPRNGAVMVIRRPAALDDDGRPEVLRPGRGAGCGRGPARLCAPALDLRAPGRRLLAAVPVRAVADMLPIALLATLVAVQTLTTGMRVVVDARAGVRPGDVLALF